MICDTQASNRAWGVNCMVARCLLVSYVSLLMWSFASSAEAQDIDDVIEHTMIERYPGQHIAWQRIDNWAPYKIPIGPVTGYRRISDWIETEGRVTRTFYTRTGTDRTASEIFLNYREALSGADFELLASRFNEDRRGNDIGSNAWLTVVYRENSLSGSGPARSLLAGNATQGGVGSIVARKNRAAGTAYVVITVEQDSSDVITALVDIVEVQSAETDLIAVDAEAIGSDIEELGRVVLDGIVFDFNSATLLSESKAALDAIAEYLEENPERRFYVVGHTDAVGTLTFNEKLSQERALAVVDALTENYSVAPGRLEPHGVGPLVPVFGASSLCPNDWRQKSTCRAR
mgnify:CR=1 FL=1